MMSEWQLSSLNCPLNTLVLQFYSLNQSGKCAFQQPLVLNIVEHYAFVYQGNHKICMFNSSVSLSLSIAIIITKLSIDSNSTYILRENSD